MNNIIDDLKFQYRIGGIANKMIYWNVGFFVIPEVFFAIARLFHVNIDYLSFVSLSTNLADLKWKPWSILSYAFFHYGFLHLFFNMMVLNFSSRLFLTFFTQKQYLGLYFMSAIFAGLCFIASFYLLHQTSNMVGASAAIMALLVATTTYKPLMEIRLLLIGNVKLWHITGVLLLLDLLQIQMENTGGHIAHLSGAFFGYIYIKLLQNGTDLSRIVNAVIDLFTQKKATPFKRVHVNPKKPTVKRESKIVLKDKTQQQLDEILDKISQSGYDSLTSEEKEFLFKTGK